MVLLEVVVEVLREVVVEVHEVHRYEEVVVAEVVECNHRSMDARLTSTYDIALGRSYPRQRTRNRNTLAMLEMVSFTVTMFACTVYPTPPMFMYIGNPPRHVPR